MSKHSLTIFLVLVLNILKSYFLSVELRSDDGRNGNIEPTSSVDSKSQLGERNAAFTTSSRELVQNF